MSTSGIKRHTALERELTALYRERGGAATGCVIGAKIIQDGNRGL